MSEARRGRHASPARATRLTLLGTRAVLFDVEGDLDLETQRRIWALAVACSAWPGVLEAAPGMNNLLVTFREPPADIDAVSCRIAEAWRHAAPLAIEGRIVELPVVYGGTGGPHMADVAAHTGLSVAEVVRLHTAPLYTVFALGSHPGYGYLGGMDRRLFVPRRAVPLQEIAGGSVSIGGFQTGVSASVGPSGWNTIGRTNAVFFDASKSPPTLLAPGDRVRFTVERVEP